MYSSISNFGNTKKLSEVDNPLTYCINNTLDNKFLHGGPLGILDAGQGCNNCQLFLSDYCSQEWDSYCEYASNNIDTHYPSTMNIPNSEYNLPELNSGEILIRNTASRKYLVKMLNGNELWKPFDPTVANSPMIREWIHTKSSQMPMTPVYMVDPNNIDNDVVMNKIIRNPKIATDILLNIYKNMKRNNTLNNLQNTNLGKFFKANSHFFN